jgi:hypothetical protein
MLPSAREPCARAEGGERHREGTGALLGALREVWSTTRIRDSDATVTHTVVRLAFEQTVENATWASRPRRGRAANASSPLIGMTPRSNLGLRTCCWRQDLCLAIPAVSSATAS